MVLVLLDLALVAMAQFFRNLSGQDGRKEFQDTAPGSAVPDETLDAATQSAIGTLGHYRTTDSIQERMLAGSDPMCEPVHHRIRNTGQRVVLVLLGRDGTCPAGRGMRRRGDEIHRVRDRSEERRVGQEWARKCRSRWA